MVEFIISLAILAMIAVPLYWGIRSMVSVWQTGTTELVTSQQLHYYLTPLTEKLSYTDTILDVSLVGDTEGYIVYEYESDYDIYIFYNSQTNQEYFNLFNTFNTNSIVFFQLGTDDSDVELLMQSVNSFEITTFAEDDQIVQVASVNNTEASVSVDEIDSVKFAMDIVLDNQTQYLEQLVYLDPVALDAANSLVFGSESLPFSLFEDAGLIDSNISVDIDESGIDADTFYLSEPEESVTILNTGEYYTTISDALDDTVSGDIVLVAYTESGYTENIIIPDGVTVRGGYEPVNWSRDTSGLDAILYSQVGLGVGDDVTAVVRMGNNSSIEGMTIDGEGLEKGIYADDVTSIRIFNNHIFNCDTPIYLTDVSVADVVQNESTGNHYVVYVDGGESLSFKRNWFFSTNAALEENVVIENSSDIYFSNNLVQQGDVGVLLSGVSTVSFFNNIILDARNFGVYIEDVTEGVVANNVIAENNAGLLLNTSNPGTFAASDISYNVFVNNVFGHGVNISLPASNIEATVSDFVWNYSNPYFVDLVSFELLSTSVLVDGGNPDAAYNDVYIDSNPSMGTVLNDIGIYGGADAGRFGNSVKTLFTESTSVTDIVSTIQDGYPGDSFIFDEGIFDLTSSIDLKPYQYLGGVHPLLTTFNHLASTALFTLEEEVMMERFYLAGNSKIGIEAESVQSGYIQQIIFDSTSIGIDLTDSVILAQFNTYYNTDVGVALSGSSDLDVSYSIFSNGSLGIQNLTGVSQESRYNVFDAMDTFYSGSLTTDGDIDAVEPVFYEASSSLFLLGSTSEAIDVDDLKDAGAVEYYFSSGLITSTELTDQLKRRYDELVIGYTSLDDRSSVYSQIDISFLDGDTSVTLNDTVLMSSSDVTSNTLILPNTIVSDALQFRLKLTSLMFNRTPYIDTVEVSWD